MPNRDLAELRDELARTWYNQLRDATRQPYEREPTTRAGLELQRNAGIVAWKNLVLEYALVTGLTPPNAEAEIRHRVNRNALIHLELDRFHELATTLAGNPLANFGNDPTR